MRFGEEAEESSFEVPDLASLRSKAKELKVATGRLAPKREDCITGLNSKIIEWRLLARARRSPATVWSMAPKLSSWPCPCPKGKCAVTYNGEVLSVNTCRAY